jgi:hypothetical protein
MIHCIIYVCRSAPDMLQAAGRDMVSDDGGKVIGWDLQLKDSAVAEKPSRCVIDYTYDFGSPSPNTVYCRGIRTVPTWTSSQLVEWADQVSNRKRDAEASAAGPSAAKTSRVEDGATAAATAEEAASDANWMGKLFPLLELSVCYSALYTESTPPLLWCGRACTFSSVIC